MLSGKWWVKLCNFFHCAVHTHNPSHQAVIATLEKIAFDTEEEKMGPHLPLSNKNGIEKKVRFILVSVVFYWYQHSKI